MLPIESDQVNLTFQLVYFMSNCTGILFDNSSLESVIHDCFYNSSYPFLTNSEDTLYEVPLEIIILLSMFYGTISVIAVVGNFLVIWIVTTSRKMQNVTNYFIANLALADIVIGLFAIPFQFQAALLQRWQLPHFMCPFCPFVQILSVTVSIFTLTAIAIDRHRAILNPLRVYLSKFRAKVSIACIWLIAFFIAGPIAFALRVEDIDYFDSYGRIHTKPFCYNTKFTDMEMLLYRLMIFLVQYLVPLSIISCVYCRMALRLWGSRTPGNAQFIRDANLMKNKKKVIKMLVIVVALFALCWLPLQTYMILQDIFPEINKYRYINIIFFVCDWLAMSNSCYNPFIYGIYNEKFKREFKQRFPFKSRRWRQSTAESMDTTERSLVPRTFSIRSHSNNINNAESKSGRSIRGSKFSSRTMNGSYLPSNSNSSKKSKAHKRTKDLYVQFTGRKSEILVGCTTEMELDELIL